MTQAPQKRRSLVKRAAGVLVGGAILYLLVAYLAMPVAWTPLYQASSGDGGRSRHHPGGRRHSG